MTEYQKITSGLLAMTHPEIALRRQRLQSQQAAAEAGPSETAALKAPWRFVKRAGAAGGAIKFAVAAFMAGSRIVPLGDNGRVVHDLSVYGARQRTDVHYT